MPLRALLDGQDIVAPLLDKSEWEALRERVRSRETDLLLPCCGSRPFQRTSVLGLQHFYHRPEAVCDKKGETLDHLAAKQAIVRGCERAGYQVWTEWEGPHWRADVLAVLGNTRVAFEVQWSRQTLKDTMLRQKRYAEDGVRGCWFFRVPPQGLRRTGDEQGIKAREDLPLFLLHQDHHATSRVYLNGRHHLLDDFVADLLRGKVHFRPSLLIPRWQPVTLLFYDVRCWSCGRISHAYCLDRPAYYSECGLPVSLRRGRRNPCGPATRKEVQRAAWAFLQTDEGLPLRVGSIKPRTIAGQERTCFGCFHCDAPFGDYALWKLEDRTREEDSCRAVHQTEVTLRRPFRRERPHWCYSPSICARGAMSPQSVCIAR